MVTFGHAMFMGIGAYAIAIPFRDHNINPLYLLALTPVAGALAALITGVFIIRSRLLYFSLLTLGVAQLFWAVEHGWQSFTGGTNGISGIFIPGWLNGDLAPEQPLLVHLRLHAHLHGHDLRDHGVAVRRCAARDQGQPASRRVHRHVGQAIRVDRVS